jgi:hypothetical protein
LVLATAWFRRPVAILLNDGHGNFSQVEPTTFPGTFRESKANWDSASNHLIDALGVPPQSQSGLCSGEKSSLRRGSSAGLISLSSTGFLFSLFLMFPAGRAPPSEVSPQS